MLFKSMILVSSFSTFVCADASARMPQMRRYLEIRHQFSNWTSNAVTHGPESLKKTLTDSTTVASNPSTILDQTGLELATTPYEGWEITSPSRPLITQTSSTDSFGPTTPNADPRSSFAEVSSVGIGDSSTRSHSSLSLIITPSPGQNSNTAEENLPTGLDGSNLGLQSVISATEQTEKTLQQTTHENDLSGHSKSSTNSAMSTTELSTKGSTTAMDQTTESLIDASSRLKSLEEVIVATFEEVFDSESQATFSDSRTTEELTPSILSLPTTSVNIDSLLTNDIEPQSSTATLLSFSGEDKLFQELDVVGDPQHRTADLSTWSVTDETMIASKGMNEKTTLSWHGSFAETTGSTETGSGDSTTETATGFSRSISITMLMHTETAALTSQLFTADDSSANGGQSQSSSAAATTRSNENHDAFGSDDDGGQSPKQKATTAGIAMGAVGLCTVCGIVAFIVAKRYRNRMQPYRRFSSDSNSENSMDVRCVGAGDLLTFPPGRLTSTGRANLTEGKELPAGRASQGGNSRRTINISQPISVTNSLNWR